MIKDFIYTLFWLERYFLISYRFKESNWFNGDWRALYSTQWRLNSIIELEDELREGEDWINVCITNIIEISKKAYWK